MDCLQQVVWLFLTLFQDVIPKKAEAGVKEKEDFEKEFWAEATNDWGVGADDDYTGGYQHDLVQESRDFSREDFSFHRVRQWEKCEGEFGELPR